MNELMIDLQAGNHKPLYEQIYDYIREQIIDGKISFQEKLPSTRLLSQHLQVSRSTVDQAYEQLLSEGYIESRPCRGYFASDISELYLVRQKEHSSGMRCVPQAAETEDDFRISFSTDQNDMTHFPYGTWRKLSKEAVVSDDPTLFDAGCPAGEEGLRKAICSYLYHARGVNCTPEQMIIGAGNEYLLILLSQVLGRNQTIGMENPTYLKAYRTLTNMQHRICTIARDESGMKMEELKNSDVTLIYTMPSHQFPLGYSIPMKRRLELLRWAGEKEDRFIIEDDHDSEFRYKGKPIPSLQGNDTAGKVIYIGTFSKSIAPSIRVSYMVLPQKLISSYEEKCGFYSSTVPKIQQMILAAFLREGYFERHLNRMRGIYKSKHDFLLTLLRKKDWVMQVQGDHAGMHLILQLPEKVSVPAVAERLKQQGVRIFPLSEFMIPGTSQEELDSHKVLLAYGGLSEQQIMEGIQYLETAVLDECL